MKISSEDDIIYKYENSNAEICVFADSDGYFSLALLSKINLNGMTFYNLRTGSYEFHRSYDGRTYLKAGKNLYFIFLQNEGIIRNVDSCGYTPVSQYISYTDKNDKSHYGVIFVVDVENNETSDNKFINYVKAEKQGYLF